MERNRFYAEARPHLAEIRIGKQDIAFDPLELDAWMDRYITRNGRPASKLKGEQIWDAKEVQGLGIAAESGPSKSRFSVKRFTKALELAASKRRNRYWPAASGSKAGEDIR